VDLLSLLAFRQLLLEPLLWPSLPPKSGVRNGESRTLRLKNMMTEVMIILDGVK